MLVGRVILAASLPDKVSLVEKYADQLKLF